jgi:hypothetical protein
MDEKMLKWAEMRLQGAAKELDKAQSLYNACVKRCDEILEGKPSLDTIQRYNNWRGMQPK